MKTRTWWTATLLLALCLMAAWISMLPRVQAQRDRMADEHLAQETATIPPTSRGIDAPFMPGLTGPRALVGPGDADVQQLPADDDWVTVIVRMQQPPVSVYRTGQAYDVRALLSASTADDVQGYAAALRLSHGQILEAASSQGIVFRLKHEYVHAFNGFGGEMRWGEREKIAALPGVAAVTLDERVEGLLEESVPLIRANLIWAGLGVTGTGIVVGMLDSGIDYTHPDLGGCLGTGCKVIGGYDFVNEDADPWDDCGHGTHTAGIVAADGITLTGVAPGASLLALKVLDANTTGTSSDVLAALDYVFDPDGDPQTDDVPDLLSMSIGVGSGSPDDPVALAVDNMVAAGIPCVAAAGNGGPGYNAVITPGGSRRAITVGGSTKQDRMFWYSSRGYYARDYIKPDVIAPAASICSAIPGNGYSCRNGTSTATPHVAGVVALLRQVHPAWGPDDLKSAIMGTAVDLGFDVFSQGAGRVDAFAAAVAPAGFQPSSLHLGLMEAGQSAWSTTAFVRLRNLQDRDLEFVLGAGDPSWPDGIRAVVSPTVVTLGPYEAVTVTLHVAVDATAPDLRDPPFSYEGRILARSSAGSASMPFVFNKAARLLIHYDSSPWMVMIHDRGATRSSVPSYPGTDVDLLLGPDTYDIMTVFDPLHVVVRENVQVARTTEITICMADAIHAVQFVPLDERGNALDGRDWWRVIRFRDTASWLATGGQAPDPGYYSPLSPDYAIEWVETAYSSVPTDTARYIIKEHRFGLAAPITWSENPADLAPVQFKYHLPPAQTQFYPVLGLIQASDPTQWPLKWLPTNQLASLESPFVQTLYFDPAGAYPYVFGYNKVLGFSTAAWSWGLQDSETPFLRSNDSGVLDGYPWGASALAVTTLANRWEVELAPARWNGRFFNHADSIQILPVTGYQYLLFVDQYENFYPAASYPYTLTSGGAVSATGSLHNNNAGFPIVPGEHSLTIGHPPAYYLAEQPVAPRVTATFDTRRQDPNPPYVTSLQLLASGRVPTNTVLYGDVLELVMAVEDDVALNGVEVAWQSLGSDDWQPVIAWQAEGYWHALLPDDLDAGDYSLRVTARDASYNEIVYTSIPGWRVVGGPRPQVSTFRAAPTVGDVPLTVHFTATTPGPVENYLWDFGDGTSAYVATPTHVYAVPGQYTVTLTVVGPDWSDTRIKPAYITVRTVPMVCLPFVSKSGGWGVIATDP